MNFLLILANREVKTFECNLISQLRGKVNILCSLAGIWVNAIPPFLIPTHSITETTKDFLLQTWSYFVHALFDVPGKNSRKIALKWNRNFSPLRKAAAKENRKTFLEKLSSSLLWNDKQCQKHRKTFSRDESKTMMASRKKQ